MLNPRHKLIRGAFLDAANKPRNQRRYLPQKKWAELINVELLLAEEKESNESEFKRVFKKWSLPNKEAIAGQPKEAHDGLIIYHVSREHLMKESKRLPVVLFCCTVRKKEQLEKIDGMSGAFWQRRYDHYNLTDLEQEDTSVVASTADAAIANQTICQRGTPTATPTSTSRGTPTRRGTRNSGVRRAHEPTGTTYASHRPAEKRSRQLQPPTEEEEDLEDEE
jgi:hypothetical protein